MVHHYTQITQDEETDISDSEVDTDMEPNILPEVRYISYWGRSFPFNVLRNIALKSVLQLSETEEEPSTYEVFEEGEEGEVILSACLYPN